MKLTLSSAALANRLIMPQKVQNSKNSLQILDCILFDVNNGILTLTASDKDNEMRTSIQLDESDMDGKFAINSKTIIDAVKELPEQPITIELDTTTYNIKIIFQNGDYNFTAQNADDFPQTQPVDEGSAKISISSELLADNITRTLFATANEEIRPVMNGIYFDLTQDRLAIVATDGRKLVRNKILTVTSEGHFLHPPEEACHDSQERTRPRRQRGGNIFQQPQRRDKIQPRNSFMPPHRRTLPQLLLGNTCKQPLPAEH